VTLAERRGAGVGTTGRPGVDRYKAMPRPAGGEISLPEVAALLRGMTRGLAAARADTPMPDPPDGGAVTVPGARAVGVATGPTAVGVEGAPDNVRAPPAPPATATVEPRATGVPRGVRAAKAPQGARIRERRDARPNFRSRTT
jgi:hypothetical protein